MLLTTTYTCMVLFKKKLKGNIRVLLNHIKVSMSHSKELLSTSK